MHRRVWLYVVKGQCISVAIHLAAGYLATQDAREDIPAIVFAKP
jgi:hypothetical protein